MDRVPARPAVALTAAAVAVLLRPDPGSLASLRADADLDTIAALLARTGVWAVAVWVLVALLAGSLARLPGAAGVAGRRLVGWCVPRALRGLVLGGVAGSVLLGPAVAATAAPVWPTTPPATAATTPGPAWPTSPAVPASPTAAPTTAPPTTTPPTTTPPTTTPPTTTPPTTTPPTTTPPTTTPPTTPPAPPPATPTPPPPTSTAPPTAPGATSVVVRPGDSLWSITTRALTRDGDAPTDARVAATWPTWYAANRAAIGSDPGLLRPGTTLHPPATDGGTP